MLVSLVLVLLTSIILYIVPQGRVAYWSGWELWGLSKTQWSNLHINLGFLFLLAGILHLYYNWKLIIIYLNSRAKQLKVFTGDFNVALALIAIISGGTLLEIPPMSTVITVGESIKDNAAVKYGEPPYGHAELSPLGLFADKTNLDFESAKTLLVEAGILGVENDTTLGQLALVNGTTPKQLYQIMKPAEIRTGDTPVFPDSPPPGIGSKTIAEICTTYNLDTATVTRELERKEFQIDPANSLKAIAGINIIDELVKNLKCHLHSTEIQ